MKLLRSLKMSRIGKQPIKVPSGVDFKVDGSSVAVKGPKGQLQRNLHPNMKIELRDGVVTNVSSPHSNSPRVGLG